MGQIKNIKLHIVTDIKHTGTMVALSPFLCTRILTGCRQSLRLTKTTTCFTLHNTNRRHVHVTNTHRDADTQQVPVEEVYTSSDAGRSATRVRHGPDDRFGWWYRSGYVVRLFDWLWCFESSLECGESA